MTIEEIMMTGNEVEAYQAEVYEAIGGTYSFIVPGPYTAEGQQRRIYTGEALRQTRENYGITKAAIARETGIGTTTIRRMEAGERVSAPQNRYKSYLLAIEAIMMRKRLSEYVVEQMHEWDIAVGD